ncbi:hypothetical protein GCM10010472_52200 [Pseudonocardia halophobica]|uniref:PhiRv1 phage protein n=1 Tax=Pseudonocardia halophobica TaxID=29401 RepID=A0A9W6L0E7_9PSEU|nr:hypothetical protein [Pseudonocardia halophobica]GLL11356.1 hypothetical protein GCM10017577_24970 [Pseudonocardia halophobica]
MTTESPLAKDVHHVRARIAGRAKQNPNDPRLSADRAELAALRLEQHVANVLATAPPLTNEQRSRIASLLAPARQTEASTP